MNFWRWHGSADSFTQNSQPLNNSETKANYLLPRAEETLGLPLLVVSPFAKANYVDGTLTDQTSILRFIEDNWGVGRIGDQSLDEKAGTLLNMFDFAHPRFRRLFLDPLTRQVIRSEGDNDADAS
jgi:phospholipase C